MFDVAVYGWDGVFIGRDVMSFTELEGAINSPPYMFIYEVEGVHIPDVVCLPREFTPYARDNGDGTGSFVGVLVGMGF